MRFFQLHGNWDDPIYQLFMTFGRIFTISKNQDQRIYVFNEISYIKALKN